MLKRDFESWCLPTLLAAFLIGRANTQVASKNADFESSSSHSHGHTYWRPPRCLSPYLKPFNCLSISSTCHLTPLPLTQTFDRQHFWRKKLFLGTFCIVLTLAAQEMRYDIVYLVVSSWCQFSPVLTPAVLQRLSTSTNSRLRDKSRGADLEGRPLLNSGPRGNSGGHKPDHTREPPSTTGSISTCRASSHLTHHILPSPETAWPIILSST